MPKQWDDNTPIYRQVRDQTVAMILEETLRPGDPLPSVRSSAAELKLNPLTVSKAYQQLVDEGLVEKRRGLGMFVVENAHELCLRDERRRFLEHEWPATLERARRLGLSMGELIDKVKQQESDS